MIFMAFNNIPQGDSACVGNNKIDACVVSDARRPA